MFGRASKYRMKLEAEGQLESGERVPVDLGRWFEMESSPGTLRYDDMDRRRPRLEELAQYVCRRYNAEAPDGRRLERIRLTDRMWKIERGAVVAVDPTGGLEKPRLPFTYCLDFVAARERT